MVLSVDTRLISSVTRSANYSPVTTSDSESSALSAISKSNSGRESPSLVGRVTVGGHESKQVETILDELGTDLEPAQLRAIDRFVSESGGNGYLEPAVTGLARPIEFCSDGSVYIHFNERIIGKGTAKTASLTLNQDTREICVRTIEKGDQSNEIAFYDQVQDIPGAAKIYQSRVYVDANGETSTQMIMPYYQMGALSQYVDDPEIDWKEDEKGGNLAKSILETAAKFHERDLSHGDLHDGNVFLDEMGNPTLADYGHSKTNASEADKKADMKEMGRFFTYMLGETHSLVLLVRNSANAVDALSACEEIL